MSDYFNNRNLAIALLTALVLMFFHIPYVDISDIAKIIVLVVAVVLLVRR